MRATVGIVTSRAPGTRVEDQGQEPPLQHHLADPLQGKRLQPHHGHVPLMFEGEVLDHVRPSHRQPQPQERDLLKLQTQKGKVAGQDLSLYFVFFHSGTEVVPLFWHFDHSCYP